MKLARIFIITLSCAIFISILGCGGGESSKEPNWSITKKGEILEIAYRYENSYPQYAALHLDSSYFRMNYGPGSGWGTSVILFPSFWERGKLYQGAKISSYNTKIEDNILIISFSGTISSLVVYGEIRLLPPEKDLLVAKVKMSINGDIQLDNRPGEAFKTVMLSSMHISDERWDAKTAYVDSQQFSIPKEGWIINPPLRGNIFGLTGGLSQWQIDNNQGPVPTVEIVLDNSMDITGWVTPSENPNDDNVGFWAASNQVIRSWEYTILAKKPVTTLAISHLEEILEKFHNSFHVYTDLSAAGNHFTLIEKIYSQEDHDKVNIDMGYKLGCYSGDTCIKAEFSPNLIGNNWGGYYFMNGILEANDSQPKPNWGDYPDAGFDLRGAKEITFFAKGEEGGETVEFFAFGIGRNPVTGIPIKPFPDSSSKVSIGFIKLTKDWKQYSIDLTGKD